MLPFTALLAAVQSMLAPLPATVPLGQKAEIQQIMDAPIDDASRRLEDRLAALPADARAPALLEAGFRRIRPEDSCGNFVYTKRISEKLVRGASAILCEAKRPFVLMTNESAEPLIAPVPGDAALHVPSARKTPPALVASPQIGSVTPTCETDPCGLLDGKRVVLVGWLLSGSQEALRPIEQALQQEYWQVTQPWQVGDHFTLRIYTSQKSFSAALSLRTRLRGAAGDKVDWTPLTVPAAP